MKRMVSPSSISYSSWPSSSQSASLTRTRMPGRTVPSFRNNSGLSCRRLSDRNNCQVIDRSGTSEGYHTSHPVEKLLYPPDLSGGRFIRQGHFVLLLLKWKCWLMITTAGHITLLNNNSAPPPNSRVKFIFLCFNFSYEERLSHPTGVNNIFQRI